MQRFAPYVSIFSINFGDGDLSQGRGVRRSVRAPPHPLGRDLEYNKGVTHRSLTTVLFHLPKTEINWALKDFNSDCGASRVAVAWPNESTCN